MIRKRSYSLWGHKIAIRGDFQRKPHGTFDRVEFFKCCREFAYSTRGNVRQYPGTNSVWILDGASIHRSPEIIHFLRSIGFLFGYIKRSFQRHYVESSGSDLLPFVVEMYTRFEKFNLANVFQHCGWTVQGHFDPSGPLSREDRQDARLKTLAAQGIDSNNHLDFFTRQTHESES
ncbi:hypothetical protein JG687_00019193 [Phytophthora cactorum]|uniref:Tc1-like transposase DDE domain-containing protein n=1 Tax=Phytophthora cactorum TaxID=29920 RepID=A0A8T1TJI5_9STRA|nr:hypothetical protein JG687_00019193 [Phytophthora cactorum]